LNWLDSIKVNNMDLNYEEILNAVPAEVNKKNKRDS
jgi:hypothetical protein